MQADVEGRVFSIVVRISGLSRDLMTTQSRLVQDLKLDGDDAIDVLLEVSKEFSMDVSGFDPSKYFHSEPTILSVLPTILELLHMRAAPMRPRNEMTIGQLIEAARRGRLSP
ncbi:DUF1493 family protein [Mesorhizobium shangrilense]|uniref:DUF1493 family protein n=1 Tax=Mesorhizobium shangrilense TaxID=460060 RepID=A0ABV2D8N3_9HYPH